MLSYRITHARLAWRVWGRLILGSRISRAHVHPPLKVKSKVTHNREGSCLAVEAEMQVARAFEYKFRVAITGIDAKLIREFSHSIFPHFPHFPYFTNLSFMCSTTLRLPTSMH